MLFQSYTGDRSAEFVHSSKGKVGEDPFGNAEIDKDVQPRESSHHDCDDTSDTEDADDSEYDKLDDDMDCRGDPNSGYGTDGTDIAIAENTNEGCTIEISGSGESVPQTCIGVKHDEFGVDNKPKPTTFLFRENPLPILCPISHILTCAIRDDAILVDGYTSAEPFFTTDLGGQGKDTGFEDKLTSYCFRRGTANAVDGVASDAVRDQVMRHDPFTGVFNGAYINNIVRFNVQDAFLESEISDDGLTRAFTHMSIRCNRDVPKEVPTEMMKSLLAADPDVVDLERQFKKLYTQIKRDFKFIRCASQTIRKQYEDVRKNLTNVKKNLKDEIEKEFRKDYFFRVHNEMMKKQLHRPSSKTLEDKEDTPIIQHQLNERYQLQQVLCDFSKDLNQQDIVSRKISAINLMVALASRQEFQTRKPRSALILKDTDKKESPAPASPPHHLMNFL
ncbi:predicted protein [Sclerotinia sclerotiorum 1980 UF-70]|nr:predicted protein [Sclerotinia sclerotiorum 1980 UF-70]EDO03048.1 predicted protein [Sclerotinia sclerotiorum 1980 UF-70]